MKRDNLESFSGENLTYLFMHMPQHRELFEMWFVDNLSIIEISGRLKLPIEDVFDAMDAALEQAKEFFMRKEETAEYVQRVWRKKR